MTIRVLILPCLLSFLTACATETVIPEPVIVEVERTVYVPVPADLTARRDAVPVPDSATYGDLVELWARDRATIAILNGRLDGIKALAMDGDE